MQQVLLSKDAEMLLSTSKSVGTLSLIVLYFSIYIFPKNNQFYLPSKGKGKEKSGGKKEHCNNQLEKRPNEKNLSKPGAHLAKMKKM